jgi:cardiolipin synthase
MKSLRRRRKRGQGYSSPNRIRLVTGGKPYFDLLAEMIRQAEKVIQLQVYILDYDETGKAVVEELIHAARRNVKVYLMADGYASQGLPKHLIKEFKQKGVEFRFFEPLFRSRHTFFGRRMHHKVIVVDNCRAMVGGINISNHYNEHDGQPAWLDFALYMEGAVAKDLCRVCQKVWKGYMPVDGGPVCGYNPGELDIRPEENSELRVRRNDWIMKRSQISRSYVEMFRRSEREIIMMTGYFLPGRFIRSNMKRAVRRGVKIRLILAGISDVKIAKYAERYMYNWLFRNHIELYEYKPCVLHAKVAVADRQWSTIGSYNVNDISAFASMELNIDVNSPVFAAGLADHFENIIAKDCVQVTQEDFRTKNGIFSRILEQLSYWIVRLLFFLFTINFKQQK